MAAIYNTTDGPIPVDADGRVVGSHETRVDVDVSTLADHIAAGHIVVLDTAVPADDAPAKTTKARTRAATEED